MSYNVTYMNKEKLIHLINLGYSQHKIARELNISQSNVRYWLYKYQLKTTKTENKTLLISPRLKKTKETVCLNCKTILLRTSLKGFSYCNSICQSTYQNTIRLSNWKLGLEKGHTGKTRHLCGWIRRYLLYKFNYSCVKCGWNKRHPIDNLPLVEINHIDGNAENCVEENLEVICPNCHSETPNFRARNKDSTRNRN